MKPLHAAVYAAKKVPAWGLYAAMKYALNRGATFAQFHTAERFEERRAIRRRLHSDFAGWLA